MNKYTVMLKPPYRSSVWAGPQAQNCVLADTETDRDKTVREAVGNRLEAVGGENVTFNRRKYCYSADLPEDMEEEVSSWAGVRKLIKEK